MMVPEHVCVFFATVLLWTPFVAADSSEEVKVSVPLMGEELVPLLDVDELKRSKDVDELLPLSTNIDSSSSEESGSVYDFTVKDFAGNDVSLSKFKGQVLIIVNYASYCSNAKLKEHYLSRLAKKYQKTLSVLMFPSNLFYENIGRKKAGLYLKRSHPEFEVFSQISVSGPDEHPLYTFLTNKLPDFWSPSIKRNFTYFVINKNGRPVQRSIFIQVVKKTVEKLMSDQTETVNS